MNGFGSHSTHQTNFMPTATIISPPLLQSASIESWQTKEGVAKFVDLLTAMAVDMAIGFKAAGKDIKCVKLAHHCQIDQIEQQFFLMDYRMPDLVH